MRRDATVVAGQRMRRLLLLIGMTITGFFVLSILDQPARADDRLVGSESTASVKQLTDAGENVGLESRLPAVRPQKAKVPKRETARPKAAVRHAAGSKKAGARHAPVSKVVKAPVREAARAKVAKVAKAATRPKKVGRLPTLPQLPELIAAPVTAQLPALQQVQALPALLRDLHVPQLVPGLPGPADPPTMPDLDALPPHALSGALVLPVTADSAPALPGSQPSFQGVSVTSGLAARVAIPQNRAAAHLVVPSYPVPGPGPHRPPADRSAAAAPARDAGGSGAPTKGTVPSSWWPEVTVTGSFATAQTTARGRSVRYAGPPS